MGIKEVELNIPADIQKTVFGQFDSYIKTIERTFKITVVVRDENVKIIGNERGCDNASAVFEQLCQSALAGNEITQQKVDYAISMRFEGNDEFISQIDTDIVCYTINGYENTKSINIRG